MDGELQNLWIEGRLETVEAWAERLLDGMGEINVLVQPRPALVMMQAEDSVERERFCVGELLVTECRVVFREQRFWGRVLENQPARALALAVLAAAQRLVPELLEALQADFDAERSFLAARRLEQARALGSTRVQFETMNPT